MLRSSFDSPPPRVRAALGTERDRVLTAITLGFSADPVARWIWRDAEAYLTAMPRFAAAFGGGAIDAGTCFVTDGFRAVSLWHAPGSGPDEEAIDRILNETVRSGISRDVEAMFGQMEEYHPAGPHWYLPMIAADPGFLGRGYGAAILEHVLRACDEAGQPAYLESSNPRNLSLYMGFGFETMGEIAPGEAPPMFPMLRRPRR